MVQAIFGASGSLPGGAMCMPNKLGKWGDREYAENRMPTSDGAGHLRDDT
jgi:hypothetical protein